MQQLKYERQRSKVKKIWVFLSLEKYKLWSDRRKNQKKVEKRKYSEVRERKKERNTERKKEN